MFSVIVDYIVFMFLRNSTEFQVTDEYVRDKWITFTVSNRLVSTTEYRFSNDLVENITSLSSTLNYLNETTIRLLVFPLHTFTLPLETSKF